METTKAKCRECKARATQYEGKLPTLGIAKLLIAGLGTYVIGLWLIVIVAAFMTRGTPEEGVVGLLVLLGVAVTLATVGVAWWMSRPKKGKVVICERCGARYGVTRAPNYTEGWDFDKIAPAVPQLEEGSAAGKADGPEGRSALVGEAESEREDKPETDAAGNAQPE